MAAAARTTVTCTACDFPVRSLIGKAPALTVMREHFKDVHPARAGSINLWTRTRTQKATR